MKVLITGANGQVGHELLACAPQGFTVSALSSAELDITDQAQVLATVELIKPALIINAAAYTAVDNAESDQAKAFAVNAQGVAYLAEAKVPLFHISTDYVFSGTAQRPYAESDTTGPTGVYGASKLAGEQRLVEINPRHIILRTAWVFGVHGNNFVKTMLRLAQTRETLSVVSDQKGGPTSAKSIAQALWQLALLYQENGELAWGTYHYAGSPACSWFAFAEQIFAQAKAQGLLSKVPQLNAITTDQYPTPAKRPACSVLDCSLLKNTFGIAQSCWQNDLKETLKILKSTSESTS